MPSFYAMLNNRINPTIPYRKPFKFYFTMVTTSRNSISASAQAANALNRETAQCLPTIKSNYYTKNIVKFRDCENFHEEKARALAERQKLSMEFAAFSREQCQLNKQKQNKQQINIKKQNKKYKNKKQNKITLKPLINKCVSAVQSIMMDCACEEVANVQFDIPNKVIKLCQIVGTAPPELIDNNFLDTQSQSAEEDDPDFNPAHFTNFSLQKALPLQMCEEDDDIDFSELTFEDDFEFLEKLWSELCQTLSEEQRLMMEEDEDAPPPFFSPCPLQAAEESDPTYNWDQQPHSIERKYKLSRSEKRNKPRQLKRNVLKNAHTTYSHLQIQSEETSESNSIKTLLYDRLGNTDQVTYFIHVCESLFITARLLKKADDKADVLFAFANLAKHHMTDRAICTPKNLQKINKYIHKLFKPQMEMQSSTDDIIYTLRNLLTDYTRVKKSPVFKKVYRLFSYFIALEIFEKAGIPLKYTGYSVLEQEVMKKKYHLGADFVHSLLDTTLFLCERGAQCWKTGELEPMFHSGTTNAEWFDLTERIKREAKILNNPALGDKPESEFLRDLDVAIEKGTSIYKYASRLSDYDRRMVNERLNDMHMIKSEILCLRFANESRQVPFSVLVFGESGVGKSTVKDILYYLFCKTRGLPSADEYKYVRNPVSDFWDGFKSNMHSLFLDDVAFMHPNKAPNGDASCLEFIQVINAIPFVPNQASLEDKGRTPFRGQLVVATTNTKDLNASFYFSHPSAIQRRFPYIIIPTPLPEYTTDGMLDSTKVPPPTPGTYPDLWTFTVQKVQTQPIGAAQKKANIDKKNNLLNDASQKEFFRWYVAAIKTHFVNQTKMTDSIKMMSEVRSCVTCTLPLTMCDCSMQSLETISYITQFLTNVVSLSIFYRCWNWIRGVRDFSNQTRDYYETLGARIQNNIQVPIFLIALSGIIATALALWRLRTIVPEMQASEGVTPEGKEERENPWYKNDYEITNFDVSRQTTSWKDLEFEKLVQIVQANTLVLQQHFRSGITNRTRRGNALALEGHKVICNLHTLNLESETLYFTITRQSSSNGVTTNIKFSMKQSDIVFYPEHDIAVMTITQLPPFKRLTSLFAKKDFSASGKGFILSRLKDSTVKVRNFIRAKRTNNVDFTHFNQGKLIHDIFSVAVDEPTEVGDCGGAYILTTPRGPVLLGIHVAGLEGVAQCLFLHDELVKEFVGKKQIISGAPMLSAESAQRDVGELSKKSVFRYIPDGSATIYGSFSGFKVAPKTRVQQTPMNAFLQQRGYSTKYTKPVMAGWKPWRIAALDLVNPVVDIDLGILNIITKQFSQTILNQLAEEDLNMLNVYDDFTALNGAAGITYVDKMNRNTSAGNPWKKSKKYFLTAIAPRGDNLEPVEASPEIMDRMHEIINRYKNGERVHPNFCAHLKDEPVTHAKRDIGKTRVFSGAPFDWSLVMRKYFLSSIRVIQRNRFIFEAAPGTICQSSEWGDIYKYLTTFGENQIVAGDYKAYDKRMPPAFILAAFDIMINICIASKNFDDEDILIMQGIAQDTAYPLTDFNGDLVEFYGSNPSGHPLTVIINSLVNSLYMRYVYYAMNPQKEVLSFVDNVKLMTYGDDNIMGVSPNTPWFNHTTIQQSLSTMGITYTMADKTSKSVPYIPISTASFLKRTWRFDEELKEYLCPLEHESIEKSLMVWTRSKTICWEEQAIAVISSAAREYFFYGRKAYQKRSELLKELVTSLGIENYLLFDRNGNSITFPTFDSLVEQFRAAGH